MIDIYILCFNREASLRMCLQSLLNLKGQKLLGNIYLYQDGGVAPFQDIAREFSNSIGRKVELIQASHNLGIKNNIERVFIDSIYRERDVIVIEDDCYCSPSVLSYCASISKANIKNNIAQFSLYNFEYNELAHCETFLPMATHIDNNFFLLKQCSSWGFFMTMDQLQSFQNAGLFKKRNLSLLPTEIASWPDQSWKKYFIAFILETNSWVIAPRASLCTTQGIAGKNTSKQLNYSVSQVIHGRSSPKDELYFDKNSNLQLLELDYYLEILNPYILASNDKEESFFHNIEMNIYGLRNSFSSPYHLSRGDKSNASNSLLIKSVQNWMGDSTYKIQRANESKHKLSVKKINNSQSYFRRLTLFRSFLSLIYLIIKRLKI
jgi:hypothetical protein